MFAKNSLSGKRTPLTPITKIKF